MPPPRYGSAAEWQFGQRVASGNARPQWWQRRVVAGLVEDERPVAVRARLDVAAVAAQHDRRGPAAVDDEDRLVAAARIQRRERRGQPARDQPAIAVPKLLAEVDDFDRRRLARRPRRQDDPAICPVASPPDAVDRRRRAAEDDGRPRQLAELDRGVAGLEPRRPVALVGGLVLLVDDDDADVAERGEDREPRPGHDVDVAGPDPPPLVGALAVRQPRMDQRDPDAEVRPEPVDDRHRERDLRHEDEGRPAGLERGHDRLDVDRGLAAAGHAVEQERRRVAGRDRRAGPARPPPPGARSATRRAAARRGARAAGRRAGGAAAPGPRRRRGRAGRGRPRSRCRGGRRASVAATAGSGRREQLGERRGLARSEGPARRPLPGGQRRGGRPGRRSVRRDPALVARPGARRRERPVQRREPAALEGAQPPDRPARPSGGDERRGRRAGRAASWSRRSRSAGVSSSGTSAARGAAPRRARAARADPAAASPGGRAPAARGSGRRSSGRARGTAAAAAGRRPGPGRRPASATIPGGGVGVAEDDPERLAPAELDEDRLAGARGRRGARRTHVGVASGRRLRRRRRSRPRRAAAAPRGPAPGPARRSARATASSARLRGSRRPVAGVASDADAAGRVAAMLVGDDRLDHLAVRSTWPVSLTTM